MYFDLDFQKRQKQEEKKQEAQLKKQYEKSEQERLSWNNMILKIPDHLSPQEKTAYSEIVEMLKNSIRYKLTESDAELIWQYCQIKLIRDRAWDQYIKNPERYIRIVTGICSDGKTPKIVVKENDHYKTLQDCNKHLEKILKDLRLTPQARRSKYE